MTALPSEFPIFPLSRALVLPGGRLPLNIFEPRYLNMVDAALARGRMFGLIQPRSRQVGDETGIDLHRVGCLGRVSSFTETEDGCYLITLVGLARFEVRAERPVVAGYRSLLGDFSAFQGDLAAAPAVIDRTVLVASLRRYFRIRGLDANWDAIEQMSDDGLVTTLCMVCPFNDGEKQALLEAPDATARASGLLALLEIGGHETNWEGPTSVS